MSELYKSVELQPFVKWAGGKRQILDELIKRVPSFNTYFEPFLGGGALLFKLQPKKAIINDINEELILTYKTIASSDYPKLLKELDKHEQQHSKDYYYKIRFLDRLENFKNLEDYQRAARLIYLNKSCFNGLYRVNKKGQFNVPFGKKDKVKTYNKQNLDAIHTYLTTNNIIILNTDFELAVKDAKKDDFIFFDPPYDKLNKESFTSYSSSDFNSNDQKRLAALVHNLSKKGVKIMLTNHNTPLIRQLYKPFNLYTLPVKRFIKAKPDRHFVEEVIITNYNL